MHPDLGHFILDLMHNVIQFQENGYLTDAIVLLFEFFEFSIDVVD
jgi:hypothetical protein